MNIEIPVYAPSIGKKETEYVLDCLSSTWISSKGAYLGKFESKFAEYTEVEYATTVSNGTVALHLALLALGVGPGDEVIVPSLTYIASVNAIAYTGATPVFVDSLYGTWQIDPEDVVKKISSRTKAVMAVHLYGHPCEMDRLVEITRSRGVFLIEDCAEAFGTLYKGQHVGGFGDISTYSFFGNKTITTGEGGMVVTNDKTLYERCIHLKGQGLATHREYWHDVIGYNYRMTNLCAAIGLAQLESADRFIERKREIASMYSSSLSGLPLEFHQETSGIRHSYWMSSILVNEAEDRDSLRAHLRESGIETRPLFYPVHTMPMYSKSFQRHPVAEDLGWRGVNLPSWPGLSDSQVNRVCEGIHGYFA